MKIGTKTPVVVHYMGDEKVFKPEPHGNAKAAGAGVFQTTLPSILTQLKKKVATSDPHVAYKQTNNKTRNLKQAQNIRYVSI